MKAIKENKVYTVDKTTKERYLKAGYDIYDENGKIIENAKNKTVPYDEYEKIKNELEELKAKEEKTKEPTVAEIKTKLEELGIEYDKKATKEALLALLPQE